MIIPVLVNTTPFSTVVRRLSKKPSKRVAPINDEALGRWVTGFLHRLPAPWYPTCLRRSAVLFHLLRRAGRSVQLCVGVQRGEDGEIDAHAWLLLNDRPHIEPSTTDPTQYKLIARFPDDRTNGSGGIDALQSKEV